MNISVVDYVGVIDGGVAVLLSLSLEDKIYNMLYWFSESGDYRLVMEENFYADYPSIRNIYEFDGLPDMIRYIDGSVLPPKSEIFREFN